MSIRPSKKEKTTNTENKTYVQEGDAQAWGRLNTRDWWQCAWVFF